jgi:hypothetical protein
MKSGGLVSGRRIVRDSYKIGFDVGVSDVGNIAAQRPTWEAKVTPRLFSKIGRLSARKA